MRISWFIVFILAITVMVVEAQEGTTGQTSQPLVGGPVVDQQTRRELGLVSVIAPGTAPVAPGTLFPGPVSGTKICSAAFLNQYWAITASHCIESATSANQIKLEAEWVGKKETRIVSDFHSFQWTHNLDIALLMINTPFSRNESTPFPKLNYRTTSDLRGQRVESFGRGLNTLAWNSPSGPMQSTMDGQFRTSDFEVFETSADSFTYRNIQDPNRSIMGGDSGGPSYFRVWDDPDSPNRQIVRLLAGVHALCNTQCLAGQTCTPQDPWRWVSGMKQCMDASVERISGEIEKRVAFVPEQPYVDKPLDPDLVVNKDTGIMSRRSRATREAATQPNEMVQAAPSSNIMKYAVASPLFTGTWTTSTAGTVYVITFSQNGNDLTASYTTPNGSATGSITGTVTDRSLTFRWIEGEQTGTGKFNLSQDGNSFEGWYNTGDDPNVVGSTWSGKRN